MKASPKIVAFVQTHASIAVANEDVGWQYAS
jgi:hypothetical protein